MTGFAKAVPNWVQVQVAPPPSILFSQIGSEAFFSNFGRLVLLSISAYRRDNTHRIAIVEIDAIHTFFWARRNEFTLSSLNTSQCCMHQPEKFGERVQTRGQCRRRSMLPRILDENTGRVSVLRKEPYIFIVFFCCLRIQKAILRGSIAT